MKLLKKLTIYSIILVVCLLAEACRDDEWNPAPDINDNIGAITKISVNPSRNFFNLLNDLADEYVEFELNVDGFGVTVVSSVDIMLIYTDASAAKTDTVLLRTITQFPSTIQVSAADAATALGKTIDDFEVGDAFLLTFPIHSADGRMFTTALNSDICTQPAQPSFGGCSVGWTVSCPLVGFTGNYTVEDSGDLIEGPAKLVSIGSTARRFEGILLPGVLDIPVSFTISMVCGDVIVPAQAIAGVSCGGPVNIRTVTVPATYDPDDDSTVIIEYEWLNCIAGTYTLTLTKN